MLLSEIQKPFYNSLKSIEVNTYLNSRVIFDEFGATIENQDFEGGVKKNLTENGTLNLIIPFKHEKECINFAKKSNLHLSREYIVYPKADKAANRTLLEFTYNKIETERGELIIENEHRHQYTEDYKNLTRDFYTIFN